MVSYGGRWGQTREDTRMVRWMCNISPEDRISAEELKTRLKLKTMRECLQDRRLE